ncbi:MAG: S9 family peptidase, partial [Candidatus Sericytochromatia bacterium]
MNNRVKNLLGALTVSTVMNVNMTAETKSIFKYPEAKKENIVEDFHGVKVSDPYRWLEDAKSEKTQNWIDEQNKITQEYIGSSDVKTRVKNRITELWNYPKYSVPYKEGDKYFFYKNDGLQNQSVLYMEDTLESEA